MASATIEAMVTSVNKTEWVRRTARSLAMVFVAGWLYGVVGVVANAQDEGICRYVRIKAPLFIYYPPDGCRNDAIPSRATLDCIEFGRARV